MVRSALANGMDWQDLDELVKVEIANGNPIASLIHELRLDQNKVCAQAASVEQTSCDPPPPPRSAYGVLLTAMGMIARW